MFWSLIGLKKSYLLTIFCKYVHVIVLLLWRLFSPQVSWIYICNFWWQVQLQLIGEGATIAYPSVFQLAPKIVSRIFVFLSVGQSVGLSLF
jgi:hypothetical protein